MDQKSFVEGLLPLLGGQANISRQSRKDMVFSFTVKDSGAVRLEALRQTEGVAAAELSRGRVKVTAKENFVEDIIMAKKDYNELADNIVGLVGGKENITFVTHCVTRLRITVKNKDGIDLEKVKKLGGVLGAQWQGDQLQIIIGQCVADAYNLVCQKNDLTGAGEVAADGGEKKKISVASVLDVLSGCITPTIPLLMAGGFLKIIVILGELAGLLVSGNPTHTVLSFAADAAFYFLPVFVGATTAKKVGANQALGMLMGAILIHPDFVAAIGAGESLNIFGLPIYSSTYSSTIFPALLSVLVMAPVEKFFAKHSPDSLRSIIEPFFTMLVMIPLSLCVLSPLGAFLGVYISNAIIWLYNTIGFLGVAVFACLCPLLVMTGMHSSLMPYMLNSFATLGWEPIVLTGMVISNIDQGAACLAVALKSKNADTKSTALGCGVTAVVGGVTEPAMYGINLAKKIPLYCAMVGSAVGGALAGLGKAVAYAITGSAGLLGGIPVYLPGGTTNVMFMCAGIGVGFVITFVLTFIMYKD